MELQDDTLSGIVSLLHRQLKHLITDVPVFEVRAVLATGNNAQYNIVCLTNWDEGHTIMIL